MKRGQLALEFLTTYGWAVLLITMIIIVMVFFSLKDADALKPVRCTFSSSALSCHEPHASADGTLTFTLSVRQDAVVTDAFCNAEGVSSIMTKNVLIDGESPGALERGTHTFTCHFDGDNPFAGRAGEKRELTATLTFDNQQSVSAAIRVKVV